LVSVPLVSFRSEEGEGSVFGIKLPRDKLPKPGELAHGERYD